MSEVLIRPDWPVPPRVVACVSTRAGGISTGAYASLNLGDHVGDAPDAVAENRRRLGRLAGLPDEPVWLEQVHGTQVADLDASAVSRQADAAFTRRAGVVCAIMTADCLPVLLAGRDGGVVGIAHAGWRGLASGVIGGLVEAMGADPADLLAWLGPAIGPEAFEVGDDVRDAMIAAFDDAGRAFVANERGRWQADLYALARLALAGAGVGSVCGGGQCTYADSSLFFSHRREAPCGRMASLIWLDA